jgi:hypothetical protein
MASTPNAPAELYSDQIHPVSRASSDEVFFLSFEAYPEPGSEHFGEVGGAYIHCYLDTDDLRSAENQAIALLQEEGWRPHRLEGWEVTSVENANDTIRNDNGHRQCDLVEIALTEGHSVVYYCWEIDAPDAIS